MQTQLARSRKDRLFAGVCGGLAAYFGIDGTIVRLIFALAIFSGLSPLVYIVLWVIMPEQALAAPPSYTPSAPQQLPHPLSSNGGPTGEWQFDPYTGEKIKRS